MGIILNKHTIGVSGAQLEALKQELLNLLQTKRIIFNGENDVLVTTALNQLLEMASGKAHIVVADELPSTTTPNTQYWLKTWDDQTKDNGRFIVITDDLNAVYYVGESDEDLSQYVKQIQIQENLTNEFYYAFKYETNLLYTKSNEDNPEIDVYTITYTEGDISAITKQENKGVLANGTLTFANIEYTYDSTHDGYYVVGSKSKIVSVNALNGLELGSGDTKVFTDVTAFPMEGISTGTIYRKNDIVYFYNNQEILDPSMYKSLDNMRLHITNYGIDYVDQEQQTLHYPWDLVTPQLINGWISEGILDVAETYAEAEAIEVQGGVYVYKTSVILDHNYSLWHNPTGETNNYLEIGGTEFQTLSEQTFVLQSNTIYDGAQLNNITFTLPTNILIDFIAQLNFSSGTIPTIFNAPNRIYFDGDDCDLGVFTPVANKRYSVLITSEGINLLGFVASR